MLKTVRSPGLESIEIPTPYLRALIEVAQEVGFDLGQDLVQAGMDPQQLERSHVTMELGDHLLRQAVALMQVPALGLLLGQRLHMHSHGSLGFAFMNASGVREAVGLLVHYFPTRTQLINLQLSENAGEARLVFQQGVHLGFAEQIVTEAVMLSVHNALRFVAPYAQLVSRVNFVAPKPGYEAQAAALFGCPVHYGQASNSICLAPDAWQVPFSGGDGEALKLAKAACNSAMAQQEKVETLSAMVRRCLLGGAGQLPSLEACAAALNLSPRTLHRRLEAEGTSFRLILDETRHRLALQHMGNPALSLQQVAYLLGYTDQANFRRAFKRWEGVAPQVRRDEAAL
jgi:AraC-like DNA-binding protein